jgi:hypothetical protein
VRQNLVLHELKRLIWYIISLNECRGTQRELEMTHVLFFFDDRLRDISSQIPNSVRARFAIRSWSQKTSTNGNRKIRHSPSVWDLS